LPPTACFRAEPEFASFVDSAIFDHGPAGEPLLET
jgi:hypothetical protein